MSLAALGAESVEALLAHCRRVAEIIPLAGFYLQLRFTGGLLGHWAVWTRSVVETFHALRALALSGVPIPRRVNRKQQ